MHAHTHTRPEACSEMCDNHHEIFSVAINKMKKGGFSRKHIETLQLLILSLRLYRTVYTVFLMDRLPFKYHRPSLVFPGFSVKALLAVAKFILRLHLLIILRRRTPIKTTQAF